MRLSLNVHVTLIKLESGSWFAHSSLQSSLLLQETKSNRQPAHSKHRFCVCYTASCNPVSCIIALTRYGIEEHAFTGNGFLGSTKAAFQVLKRNFVGGCVTDRVGTSVVYAMCKIFATGLGMLAWKWIDTVMDVNTMDVIMDDVGEEMVLQALFAVALIYFTNIPIFSIVLLIMLPAGYIKPEYYGAIGGFFTGAVCAVIFQFV